MEKEQDVRIMPDFSQTFKKLPTPPSSNLLYIEASIASVQEFEDLLQCWDRKLLLKVVSGFVCDDPEAAEDIVQYAFFRVYRSLNNSRPYVVPRDILEHLKTIDSASEDLDLSQREVKVTNPSAWMYTILRNPARNHHRTKKRSEKKLNELMREM